MIDQTPTAAGGILLAPTKEILLLRRKKLPQVWELPGGHLEKGENAWEAANREIYEETGMRYVEHQKKAFIQHIPHSYNTYATYIVPSPKFAPRMSKEHDAFVWLMPQEIMIMSKVHPKVQELIRSIRWR